MLSKSDIQNFIDFIEIIEYFEHNLTDAEQEEFIFEITQLIAEYKLKIDERN